MEDLSDLSWKFQFSFGFPFEILAFKTKYPLLGWFEYFVSHHMIQYINIWMQHDNDDGYGQFTGHYEGN